jgi:uncharacterized protein (UPF0297 family)
MINGKKGTRKDESRVKITPHTTQEKGATLVSGIASSVVEGSSSSLPDDSKVVMEVRRVRRRGFIEEMLRCPPEAYLTLPYLT